MIQSLRSLVSVPSRHASGVVPSAATSAVASPARRGLSPLPTTDRLALQSHLTSMRGRVPAQGIQFGFTTPVTQSEPPTEEMLAIQLAKISHVAPSLRELPNFSVTPLKIAIEKDQQQASFQVSNATLSIETAEGTQRIASDLSGNFEARSRGTQIEVLQNGQSLGVFTGTLKIEHDQESMQINGNTFRGDLRFAPADQGHKFHVVNDVLLEDYLKSVVPSESPASWPQESLQAQALAARTYAVANWGKHKSSGFDMNDNTSDQVYKGMKTEHPGTQEAVKATTGQIITHGNKPITALFFSASGGYTDSSKEVWGTELPYIQAVPDFDQAASRYRWNLKRSAQQVQQSLEKMGHNVGAIQHIEPLTHTPQGRVKTLKVIGSRGSVTLDSNKFRFAAKLYSTKWKVTKQGPNFSFDGGGWGHALGMSQWGARQMAKDGYLAKDIINHYYQGVEIQSLD